MTDETKALNLHTAEKVMGWKRTKRHSCMGEGEFRSDGDDVLLCVDFGRTLHVWNPCESKADALDVLAKCALVPLMISDNGAAGWSVSQINGRRLYAEADTLPLAICRFAKLIFV